MLRRFLEWWSFHPSLDLLGNVGPHVGSIDLCSSRKHLLAIVDELKRENASLSSALSERTASCEMYETRYRNSKERVSMLLYIVHALIQKVESLQMKPSKEAMVKNGSFFPQQGLVMHDRFRKSMRKIADELGLEMKDPSIEQLDTLLVSCQNLNEELRSTREIVELLENQIIQMEEGEEVKGSSFTSSLRTTMQMIESLKSSLKEERGARREAETRHEVSLHHIAELEHKIVTLESKIRDLSSTNVRFHLPDNTTDKLIQIERLRFRAQTYWAVRAVQHARSMSKQNQTKTDKLETVEDMFKELSSSNVYTVNQNQQ